MIANMYDQDWAHRFFADLVVAYAFDMFFLVDLVMRANFFAIDAISAIVSDPVEIRRVFMARCSYEHMIDFFASLPFDLVALSVGSFYLPVLRICKLLRMVYLPTYAKRVEEAIRDKTGIQLSFTSHRIIVLHCIIFIVSCLKYLGMQLVRRKYVTC